MASDVAARQLLELYKSLQSQFKFPIGEALSNQSQSTQPGSLTLSSEFDDQSLSTQSEDLTEASVFENPLPEDAKPNGISNFARSYTKRFSGWRFGITLVSSLVAIVLVINISFTIYAITSFPVTNGIGMLKHGNCKQVAQLNTLAQLCINVLSSAMLAGSNYCMQRLCAPTREEVDRAHGRDAWLDIGVLSVHNLMSISKFRTAIWIALALSSLPLHLLYSSVKQGMSLAEINQPVRDPRNMFEQLANLKFPILSYNAAIFQEIAGHRYSVLTVTEHFLHRRPEEISNYVKELSQTFSNTRTTDTPPYGRLIHNLEHILWVRNHLNQFERLEPWQCINTYKALVQPSNADVMLVVSPRQNTTFLVTDFQTIHPNKADSNRWVCQSTKCDPDQLPPRIPWSLPAEDNKNKAHLPLVSKPHLTVKFSAIDYLWLSGPEYWDFEYCLSQKVPPHCRLKFSVGILVVVIICNFIKLACLILTIWKFNQPTLVTLGDAISSFLQKPDPTTRNMCTASRHDVKHHLSKICHYADSTPSNIMALSYPRKWDFARHFWCTSISLKRWIITNMLCILGIVLPLFLLSSSGKLDDIRSIAQYGFGEINVSASITATGDLALTSNILLANLPQLLLSILYFMYNGIFTCQLVTAEWTDYYEKKKPLRVTIPGPGQISSYYLNLPYLYSLPLLVLSTFMHWLLSRSIFFVKIVIYDYLDRDWTTRPPVEGNEDLSQCGYSPLAILISAVVASMFILVGIINGFRRYQGGMPLAATCSVSLSAACHPPEDQVPNLAFGPVQWGVVSRDSQSGIGHLAFSGRKVSRPRKEDLYMGTGPTSKKDEIKVE